MEVYIILKSIDTKEKILITASKLFQKQGYHATGLNQIIKESGCPKGSLYYYFPDGKEQLVEEAVFRATEDMRQEVDNLLSAYDNVIDAIDHLFNFHEEIDVKAEYDGIPLALIAMETALISERIRIACRDSYTLLISMWADKFVASNWPRQAAVEISTLIFAIIQGNGIVAMTQLSNEPFKLAHKQVMEIIRNKEKELDLDGPTVTN